jgi:hypothetical protein
MSPGNGFNAVASRASVFTSLLADDCLTKSESKLCYDRRSVDHSILVSSSIWGPRSDFCYYQTVSGMLTTRGRVCRIQLLLVLASAVVLGSESRGTHDHILLSQIRDSPNPEDQIPVLSYNPRHRVHFSSPPTNRRACTIYSLRSLGTECIENTSTNRYSIAALRSYRTDRVENSDFQLLHCCMLEVCCIATTRVFVKPFPSNSCLCWLYSSCFEQICHNIKKNLYRVSIILFDPFKWSHIYELQQGQ